jgi:AraC family transcriptional regulator, positive regulator of tynA and feaB
MDGNMSSIAPFKRILLHRAARHSFFLIGTSMQAAALKLPGRRCDGFFETPRLNYESWRDTMQSCLGSCYGAITEPQGFSGRMRAGTLYGLPCLEIGFSASRFERTRRDASVDGIDWYHAVFSIRGQLSVIQDNRVVNLASGSVALIDAARPATYVFASELPQMLSLKLPRASVLTHLGSELESCLPVGQATQAERLLFQLVLDADAEACGISPRTVSHMQLAIYDLIGAMFSTTDQISVSPHTDRLFRRICALIMDRFKDPDFGPAELAAELGISQRYLQKIFRARGLICNHYIQSVRLDHAARIFCRRRELGESRPLSEVAYDCGFNDYNNFVRRFRQRFGHAPSAHGAAPKSNG